MHPFNRILVYASLEDDVFFAMEQAAAVARACGASLGIARVLEDGERWSHRKTRGHDDAELRRFLEESQRETLEAQVAPLREEGLDVHLEVRWGTPWLELIHLVLRDDYDLVVKAAEGAARGKGLFFGSTALHLIRKCPCPVWIVSGLRDAGPGHIVAAIDPTEDETRSALAQRILNLAASMAENGEEVHVVSAWRAPGESPNLRRVRPNEFAEYASSARDEARESLERILADAGDPVEPKHVHLLKGDARELLPEFVEHHRFALVVMGSLGRTGIAGLLIGETAETLIRSIRCSVLVAKPPDFECPVRLPSDPT